MPKVLNELLKLVGGIQIPPGAAQGKVLTSDAVGNGTWQPVGGAVPNTAARAWLRNSPGSIASGIAAKLPLDTPSYDPGGNFSAASGRYVCPSAGYYSVSARVAVTGAGGNNIFALVYKNGAEATAGDAVAGATYSSTAGDTIQCAAGDYLELYVYNGSGVAQTPALALDACFLAVVKVDSGGPPGAGWHVYSGSGSPTGIAANNGDYTVRQSDGEVFQMVTGAWVDQGWSLAGGNLNQSLAARAYRAAAYSLSASTWTKLPLDTKSYDPGTNFSLTNNRYVCPVAGYYEVRGQMSNNVTVSGVRLAIGIYKNGALAALGNEVESAGSGEIPSAVVTDAIQCAAGDYLELWYYTSNADTIPVGAYENFFSVSLVAATAVQQQPLQAATQARAYRNAAFSLTAGQVSTWVKLPLDALSFDASGGAMQLANSRYVCPTGGYYEVVGSIIAATPPAGNRVVVAIYKNGTQINEAEVESAAAGEYPTPVVSDVVQCNAGDYLEVWLLSTAQITLQAGNPSWNYLAVSQVGTNPVAAPASAARLRRNAAWTIPTAATFLKVPVDTVDFDPGGNAQIANNRYVCPVAGQYRVDAQVAVNVGTGNTNVTVIAAIFKNGAQAPGEVRFAQSDSGGYITPFVSDLIQCNAGDYLELYVYSTGLWALGLGSMNNYLAVSLVSTAPAPLSVALPQAVSGLPSSPVDGQEVFFLADATNGIVWRLRYRAASASAHKWEFVGGSPLRAENTGALAVPAGTTTLDTLSVTLPLPGDYEIDYGGRLYLGANASGQLVFQVDAVSGGSSAPIFAFSSIDVWLNAQSGNPFSSINAARMVGRAVDALAGDRVRSHFSAGTAAVGEFEKTYILVRPIRVG